MSGERRREKERERRKMDEGEYDNEVVGGKSKEGGMRCGIRVREVGWGYREMEEKDWTWRVWEEREWKRREDRRFFFIIALVFNGLFRGGSRIFFFCEIQKGIF